MTTRRVLIVLGIGLGTVVAGLAAVYTLQPPVAPAVNFTDDLTGPTSPFFDIPFAKYTLTPEGLLRAHSRSGRSNGDDRPVVRTWSDQYLSRDFVFEVDVTIPADVEDIAFVGFGEGIPTMPHKEPGGAFGFRIHAMPSNREVRFAALSSPTRGEPVTYAFEELIGTVPVAGTLTIRIEKSGDQVVGSLPGHEGSERTLRISAYPSVLGRGRGFLYLSNTAEGTVFSDVRVRPRT